jgi:hypothetical protein
MVSAQRWGNAGEKVFMRRLAGRVEAEAACVGVPAHCCAVSIRPQPMHDNTVTRPSADQTAGARRLPVTAGPRVTELPMGFDRSCVRRIDPAAFHGTVLR